LSNILGVTTRAIRKTMKNLKDKGIIERVGSDRKGYWKIIK
jgi:ATP-dependent DNA helicase RecG